MVSCYYFIFTFLQAGSPKNIPGHNCTLRFRPLLNHVDKIFYARFLVEEERKCLLT